MAAPPAPADEIRGLHLLYVKEVVAPAAPSSLAASPAAAAAAPGAPAPASSLAAAPAAADTPELYLGEDNKLYGIDGTQLVRINVDGGNLVRVADAAAHVEKKDADEDVITGKEYKSAETAAVRHARRALTELQGRFPMIDNIGDLRARLEECCRGIGAAPGAAGAEVALRLEVEDLRRQLDAAIAASAAGAPPAAPGAPKEGSVDVIKLLTDDINNNILGNIFNLHVDIKKELLKIFDIVKDLKNGKELDIAVKSKPFIDANALLTNLNNYFHECNATLGIGYRIMNGNEDFRKLLDKLDKSIQLGVLFHESCRKFMDAVWLIMQDADANYDYYDTLEEKFTGAIDLHSRYIEDNYEDNADLTEAAVKKAYGAIKYEEEGGDGGDEEEGKEEEEEEEEEEENANNASSVETGGSEENDNNASSVGSGGSEENANNASSVVSGGTEEGKKEGDNSNNGSSVETGGTEESKEGEENDNNASSVSSVGSGSSANIDKMAAAMNKEYGTPVAAAAPKPRKPQTGGARNRRVTPIGKKIGGISIKKRTPKKKSRSKNH